MHMHIDTNGFYLTNYTPMRDQKTVGKKRTNIQLHLRPSAWIFQLPPKSPSAPFALGRFLLPFGRPRGRLPGPPPPEAAASSSAERLPAPSKRGDDVDVLLFSGIAEVDVPMTPAAAAAAPFILRSFRYLMREQILVLLSLLLVSQRISGGKDGKLRLRCGLFFKCLLECWKGGHAEFDT